MQASLTNNVYVYKERMGKTRDIYKSHGLPAAFIEQKIQHSVSINSQRKILLPNTPVLGL